MEGQIQPKQASTLRSSIDTKTVMGLVGSLIVLVSFLLPAFPRQITQTTVRFSAEPGFIEQAQRRNDFSVVESESTEDGLKAEIIRVADGARIGVLERPEQPAEMTILQDFPILIFDQLRTQQKPPGEELDLLEVRADVAPTVIGNGSYFAWVREYIAGQNREIPLEGDLSPAIVRPPSGERALASGIPS